MHSSLPTRVRNQPVVGLQPSIFWTGRSSARFNFWQLAPRHIESGAQRGMVLLVSRSNPLPPELAGQIKIWANAQGGRCQGNVSAFADVRQPAKGEPSGPFHPFRIQRMKELGETSPSVLANIDLLFRTAWVLSVLTWHNGRCSRAASSRDFPVTPSRRHLFNRLILPVRHTRSNSPAMTNPPAAEQDRRYFRKPDSHARSSFRMTRRRTPRQASEHEAQRRVTRLTPQPLRVL